MKELSEIMKIADRQERLIEARLYQEAKKGFAEGFAKSRAEERVRILKRYRIFLDSTGFSDELKKSMYDGFVATLS